MRTRLQYCLVGIFLMACVVSGAEPPFAWVPSYPGAHHVTNSTIKKSDQLIYKLEFEVDDKGVAVRAFYEKKLKAAGLSIISKGGITGNSWDLIGDSQDGTRSIDVNGNAQSQGVNVRITARRSASD